MLLPSPFALFSFICGVNITSTSQFFMATVLGTLPFSILCSFAGFYYGVENNFLAIGVICCIAMLMNSAAQAMFNNRIKQFKEMVAIDHKSVY